MGTMVGRTEFTLPARQLKAAMNFVSAKDEVRHYLQGVHINPEENRIEATDGHSLFAAQSMYPVNDLDDMILLVDGKIPKDADLARFFIVENEMQQLDFCEEPSGYIWFEDIDGQPVTKANGIKESRLFRVISGDFPDLSRLLSPGNPEEIDSIAIDPSLMGRVSAACSALGVSTVIPMQFYGQTNAVRFHLTEEKAMAETTMMIMPCRSAEEKS